jgi:ubiquinone/menaquinone biosynthesis C-methylase UbiE
MNWILGGLLLIIIGLVLYWLIIITEGVFLGRKLVIWLYDLTARRYDGIKQFNHEDDTLAIARPLSETLQGNTNPILLDVATGTGRVPEIMLSYPGFDGQLIAVDPAREMLAEATRKLSALWPDISGRWFLIRGTAAPLPFASKQFHAVSCLEALEFMPSDIDALRELIRVLKPGGVLMTSRRRGWEAHLFLGRYRSRKRFEELLCELGLIEIRTLLWQLDYDMVVGRKPALQQ